MAHPACVCLQPLEQKLSDEKHSSNESPDASSDLMVTVEERAQAVGWQTHWRTVPSTIPSGEQQRYLLIEIPNGRDVRTVSFTSRRAEQLAGIPFEQFRIIGNYHAISNPTESYIEASIRPANRFPGRSLELINIPGVELVSRQTLSAHEYGDEPSEALEPVNGSSAESQKVKWGDRWRLKISDPSKSWFAEFSEASPAGAVLISDVARRTTTRQTLPTTFKLFGVSAATHDEALRVLEEISGAVFFELDLRYGVSYEISRYTAPRPLRTWHHTRVEQPPLIPRFHYPAEALSLYNYGRSASGMPLLQYLAFYQVLEFFFPQHFKRHQLLRLRQELIDPRFDVTNDGHVARILSLASAGSGRGGASERDQLKATIGGCTDENTLRDFINEDADRLEALGDKKRIKNVPVIDMGQRAASILDQTAERIYSLRCRIVHTKGDGGENTADFLLPSSQEATSLSIDVELIQFIAQKAIIASGSPLGI